MSRALGRYELLRPLARGGMAEVYPGPAPRGRRREVVGGQAHAPRARRRRPVPRPVRARGAAVDEPGPPEHRPGVRLRADRRPGVPRDGAGRGQATSARACARAAEPPLPMPPLLAAFVAAECCQALDYAHRRRGPDGAPLGIVHRDVTPRNVLLSWSGEVKLTDFGIAALAGERADRGHRHAGVHGAGAGARRAARSTRRRLRGRPGAARGADRSATPSRRRARERRSPLPARATLVPWPDGFDPKLRAIADRATALDPEARYPDARAMLEELDAFIVGERAANKCEAPTRLLAAWLTDVWKEEREDGRDRRGDRGLAPRAASSTTARST